MKPDFIAHRAFGVKTFLWRGIRLSLMQHSLHSGYVSLESSGATWKVVRYRTGDIWHARLRLGVHRIHGQGASKFKALDAAYHEATLFHGLMTAALAVLSDPSDPSHREDDSSH